MVQVSKSQIKLVRSLQQKKFRDELHLFVAEGRKCISELMPAFDIEMLVVSDKEMLAEWGSVNPLWATETEIQQMSSLRTPQGCIAVFRRRNTNEHSMEDIDTLVVALDGVQDPGNLGTILRTCDWFGVKKVVCSPSTADCYNPKVVQATMGALARVEVKYTDIAEWIMTLQRTASMPIYGTLLDGTNIYLPDAIPERNKGVVVMGNEGNGISDEVRPFITHPLYIPCYGSQTVESLNVAIATAVTLAEFRRPQ